MFQNEQIFIFDKVSAASDESIEICLALFLADLILHRPSIAHRHLAVRFHDPVHGPSPRRALSARFMQCRKIPDRSRLPFPSHLASPGAPPKMPQKLAACRLFSPRALNRSLDSLRPGPDDLGQGFWSCLQLSQGGSDQELLDDLQLIAKDYGYKWTKCVTRMEATED